MNDSEVSPGSPLWYCTQFTLKKLHKLLEKKERKVQRAPDNFSTGSAGTTNFLIW